MVRRDVAEPFESAVLEAILQELGLSSQLESLLILNCGCGVVAAAAAASGVQRIVVNSSCALAVSNALLNIRATAPHANGSGVVSAVQSAKLLGGGFGIVYASWNTGLLQQPQLVQLSRHAQLIVGTDQPLGLVVQQAQTHGWAAAAMGKHTVCLSNPTFVKWSSCTE